MKKPTVVCLCGSTRFKDVFIEANKRETLAGKIVLTVGTFPHTDAGAAPEDVLGVEVKAGLDELHKRKIDLADEILVLNVGGYIGSSTRGEITYAQDVGKPIRYWEAEVPRPFLAPKPRALESLLFPNEQLVLSASGDWTLYEASELLLSLGGGYSAARDWLEKRRPK